MSPVQARSGAALAPQDTPATRPQEQCIIHLAQRSELLQEIPEEQRHSATKGHVNVALLEQVWHRGACDLLAYDPHALEELWWRSDTPMAALYRTIRLTPLGRHKRSQVYPSSHESIQGKQIGISQHNLGRVYCPPLLRH